jgi:hypothetical protein
MINTPEVQAWINYITVALSGYIFVTGTGRLASMGWKTHKHVWILVYALLVCAAGGNIFLVLDGKAHAIPILGLLATCLWFHESRNRWKNTAPVYMQRGAADTDMLAGPR